MARKKEIVFHRCADCAHAKLIRWTGDPLISECKRSGERQVASTVLPCTGFRQRAGEAEVENRKKRIGITEVYI